MQPLNSNFLVKGSLSTQISLNKEHCDALIGRSRGEAGKSNREIREKYGEANPKKGMEYQAQYDGKKLFEWYMASISGHSITNLFTPDPEREGNKFGSYQKKNANFEGSQMIGVDIDHSNVKDVIAFCEALPEYAKPSYAYSTFSHLEEGKGVRFRMMYALETLVKNPYIYKFVAGKLNKIVVEAAKEAGYEVEIDECNLRCAQYFNGTNINSVFLENKPVHKYYGKIYSLEDLGADNLEELVEFLRDNAEYKTKNKARTAEIEYLLQLITGESKASNLKEFFIENQDKVELPDSLKVELITKEISKKHQVILNDWDSYDYKGFQKGSFWRDELKKTKYIFRVEKDAWINDSYQFIDDDYFALFCYGKNNTQKDGQKRRIGIYQRMCLRRVIKPNITIEEMLVNTLIDIMRFYDNSDKILNSKFILKNIFNCFNEDLEDILEREAETIEYLKKNTRPKKGVIFKCREKFNKATIWQILDNFYNEELSLAENLELINNEHNYKIGKSSLYNYAQEKGIELNSTMSKTLIIDFIDLGKSANKNYKEFREAGFKCDRKVFLEYYKEKKENRVTPEVKKPRKQYTKKGKEIKLETPVEAPALNAWGNVPFNSSQSYFQEVEETKVEPTPAIDCSTFGVGFGVSANKENIKEETPVIIGSPFNFETPKLEVPGMASLWGTSKRENLENENKEVEEIKEEKPKKEVFGTMGFSFSLPSFGL